MNPRVTVIIPCYNNVAHVGDALASALGQTRPADEVLVIDDGSTDGSADVIARYGDRVRVIGQSNAGRAAAVNRGIREAGGELIGILDADDMWWPRLLEKNVAALMEAEADVAYCQALLCDERGKDLGRSYGGAMATSNVVRRLLVDNQIINSACVCRTDVLQRVGGYVGAFWPCDDYHLWLRIAARGKIVFQPEPMVRYRVHAAQASRGDVFMAKKKLDAKLAFLADHPEVASPLGQDFIRQATDDQFYGLCMEAFRQRRVRAARALAGHYVRRFPARLRGWWLLARAELPWRIYSRLPSTRPEADELERGIATDV